MESQEPRIKYKNFARVAIAIILVVAIGTSLWYAAPTKALEISFPSLPSGNLGSTHTFSVKVDLNSAELVPIQSINMEIYNVTDTSKIATCTNLPLANGGAASYSNTDTGGGWLPRLERGATLSCCIIISFYHQHSPRCH
jgi:hypothetical protein